MLASPPPADRTISWEVSTIDGSAAGALASFGVSLL
jgi:hypothetical protein